MSESFIYVTVSGFSSSSNTVILSAVFMTTLANFLCLSVFFLVYYLLLCLFL